MLEEETPILPHVIFLGLVQLEGVGFQTIYNYFNDGKSLSDPMMVDNLKDFMNLLGRTINTKNENYCLYILTRAIIKSCLKKKCGVRGLSPQICQIPWHLSLWKTFTIRLLSQTAMNQIKLKKLVKMIKPQKRRRQLKVLKN